MVKRSGAMCRIRAESNALKRLAGVATLVVLATGPSSCASRPPVARKIPHVEVVHGVPRVDPYHWLRERGSEAVLEYLAAENRYADGALRHVRPLEQTLYAEMKGRLKETDETVPKRMDDFEYFSRTVEGKQYPIHCRKPVGFDGAEEVILDENLLAAGRPYFRVGAFALSPDQRLLAYSTDESGAEGFTLRVKDLASGELLADQIENTSPAVVWANDNRTVFYTVLDEAKRPYRVYRHRLGGKPEDDEPVYEEADDRFFVRLSKTRSRRYLLMTVGSQITSEVHVLDADAPEGSFALVEPRRQGIEYRVAHQDKYFYIVTNDGAINFKLVRAPVEAPQRRNWETVVAHCPEVKLDGVDAFQNFLAIYEREQGLKTLRIVDRLRAREYSVHFPEPVYTFSAEDNEMYNATTLRIRYSSLSTPPTVLDYHTDSQLREVRKRQEVLGGYDPAQYQSQRLFATSPDGQQVPISLIYRKGMVRDGSNPLLLTAYGSYGASFDPSFSSNRVSLLDRGVVFAIAHVRGGGELGRPWYEDGKLLHKRNTFRDFIACAEHLIAERFTSPERLGIMGGSAGGLLMGAVVNMRPDLFKAVVAHVPFVDVVNTMLDPTLPLTVPEYEEWGDPRDKAYYDYMMTYSPYDNVAAKAYPNMLITAGLNDARVQYWEPAKWTARLREVKQDGNLLVLKTHMGAGHGGASGRYDALRETALHCAFLLDALGLRR